MLEHLAGKWLSVGACASLVLCGSAQDRGAKPSPESESTDVSATVSVAAHPATSKPVTAEKQPSNSSISKGVQEILKMVDAGVTKEVIKTYVENLSHVGAVTGTDVVALKEHGVPDEISIALLKRSGEMRQQRIQNSAPRDLPIAANNRAPLSPDPESYDYFQYYYLLPRTLGYAYERLGAYPPAYFPGYGGFGYPPAYRR